MTKNNLDTLKEDAVSLLKELIATPSFSKEEGETAEIISRFFEMRGLTTNRIGNNIFSFNKNFDPAKPAILLNSHHDTVKPNAEYTRDPFLPDIENGKLYGLGSNDAGGALVSLVAAFVHFYQKENLRYNLAFAATAEEEISGNNGIEALLNDESFNHVFTGKGRIDCAIVGEPTKIQMAVAERGLMVLDCIAHGKAGHAAREEGENAIYKAMMDIEWFYTYQFPKVSELLGPVKMSVTVIETKNKAHNVVPSQCQFIVDVRVNELYTFEEVFDIIRSNVQSELKARSTRMRSSSIELNHPLVKAGSALGRSYYGSPTTSDKALMPFPALKMGPGDSARSHIADEFIYIDEIKEGIEVYIALLEKLLL